MATYTLHVIIGSNSTIQSNYRTGRISRYCCPNHHRSGSMFHSSNQAFRIKGFFGRFPNINPAWCWEQREWRLIWPHNVFPVIRRSDFMIIKPSFSPFSVVFSSQTFSNCSSTVDVGFLKLSSNCFYGNKTFKINIHFCCHFCCSSIILDTILFNVWRSLSLSIGFRPLFLLADDVLPWFMHAIVTMETAALPKPNKVAVLFTDAAAKHVSTI